MKQNQSNPHEKMNYFGIVTKYPTAGRPKLGRTGSLPRIDPESHQRLREMAYARRESMATTLERLIDAAARK